MVVAIIHDIGSSLHRIDFVLLHFLYYRIIWRYDVLPHDYSPGFVLWLVQRIELRLSDLMNLETSLRIYVQNCSENVSRVTRQNLWHLEVTSDDLFVKFVRIRVFKRKISAQHSVENDSARPYVNIQTLVSFSSNHLRCSITRRSTSSFQLFS